MNIITPTGVPMVICIRSAAEKTTSLDYPHSHKQQEMLLVRYC